MGMGVHDDDNRSSAFAVTSAACIFAEILQDMANGGRVSGRLVAHLSSLVSQ